MPITFATITGRITIPGTEVGIRAQVTATPLTTDNVLVHDDRTDWGSVVAETDNDGNLPAAFKLPTNGYPAEALWKFVVTPLEKKSTLRTWTLGVFDVTASTTIQALLIAGGIDVTAVDVTFREDVFEARDSASTAATTAAASATSAAASAAAAQAIVLGDADTVLATVVNDPSSDTSAALTATFAQHPDILEPWFAALRADPANAKIALGPGDSTTDVAASGVSLHNRLKNFHRAPLEGLGGMQASNILNFGFNGITIEAWLADATAKVAAIVAAAPHLIVYSLGINTIRTTALTTAQMTAKHRQVIDLLRAALPGTPIIARIPNTFLTTDVGSAGYVTPNSDAAAKSATLRASYLALIGAYPDVLVYDAPERVFGTTAPATSAYMGDQLHPNATGFNALADDLVDNFIGRKAPFNAGMANIAKATAPYVPWTVYGRAVEDPDRYVHVAAGEFSGQGSTYIDFGYPGPRGGGTVAGGGNITYYDLIEMPDGQVARIGSSGWQVINQNAGITRILSPASAIPTYSGTGGTVRVWRQKVGGDVDVENALRDTSWKYRRAGRVIAGGTTFIDIGAFSTDAARATELASTWTATTGDKVYVEGKGTAPITMTGGNFGANGNNLRIFGGLDGTDWNLYVGRLVAVVGTHA